MVRNYKTHIEVQQFDLSLLNQTLKTSYNSFEAISLDHLKQYLDWTLPEEDVDQYEAYWNSHVAEKKDIITDLHYSNYSHLFPRVPSKHKKHLPSRLGVNLAARSVEGHAHAGHTTFRDNPKGNTSLFHIISDDILKNYRDPKGRQYYGDFVFKESKFGDLSSIDYRDRTPKEHYLEESQDFINSIAQFLDHVLDGRTKKVSVKQFREKELINAFIPPHINQLDSQALLKGAVFGGNFDNYEDIRMEAERIYGLEIGGGTQALLNVQAAKRYTVGLDELAHSDFKISLLNYLSPTKRFALFEHLGIIRTPDSVDMQHVDSWNDVLDQGHNVLSSSQEIPIYIRQKKGLGVSDDAACIFVGFHDFNPTMKSRGPLWYLSSQIGSHLIDGVDTLEKASTYFFAKGQDQLLSDYISKKWFDKVTSNSSYRRTHNIDVSELEKRVLSDNSTNFALFPKEEIIDLTAASANPQRGFNGSSIHSSLRYFLQSLELRPRGLTNSGKKTNKRVLSNVFTQEKIYAQKLFEHYNAEVKINDGYLIPGKCYYSEFDIGFQEVPANKAFQYFDKVASLVHDPATRRKKFINRYRKQ